MFHVFVRKSLATRTLRQSDISSTCRLNPIFRNLGRVRGSLVGVRGARQIWVRWFGGRCGALVATQDMIQLGDGIAAFDADWHAALLPRA